MLSLPAAFAGTRYVQAGEPITDISQMKGDDHGGLYMIHAYQGNRMKSGFFYASGIRFQYDGVAPSLPVEVNPEGEANMNYIFQISFVDDNSFTVKNLGLNQYLSVRGQNGIGKHNAVPTVDGSDNKIAEFTLVNIPENHAIVNADDYLKNKRFLVQMTNATFDGNAANEGSLWFSNDRDANNPALGGMLTYHQNKFVNGNCQAAFIPVKVHPC